MQTSSAPAVSMPSNSREAALRWKQAVLAELAKTALANIADAVEKDETGACRVRSGETKLTFGEALNLLAGIGFKAVPSDAICVRSDRFEAIATIAQAAMADEQTARRLIWEDES